MLDLKKSAPNQQILVPRTFFDLKRPQLVQTGLFIFYSKPDKVTMAIQKQPRLGHFLDSAMDHCMDSAYEFGKNNKNEKWFKDAISQMGLKEKWITKDQSNNRLVKMLLFFGLILLIVANILIVKCYKGSLEMKKPNWIMNNGTGKKG